MDTPLIGIDLGTTNSLIAYFDGEKSQLIPNRFNQNLTPSVVSIDKDGSILTGLPARERLYTAPELTAAAFKRYMGTDKRFKLGKKTFRAEELSALILKSLISDAEQYLNCAIKEAVITVPAYFNALQREAVKNAAELADIKVSRLLNEPTAAGLAYGIVEKPNDTRFLIYDLGGGTFDVSILDYFDGIVQVSASAGDNRLGGEDFVRVLGKLFAEKCPNLSAQEHEALPDNPVLWQQLEGAKRQFTTEKIVTLSYQSQQVQITREEYQKACEPLLSRLRQPLIRALRDAKRRPEEIDDIILIGGATKMPLIRSTVAALFQRIPSNAINPDEAVALGAAIQAGLIARQSALEDIILTDVMPFSLGTAITEIINGRYIDGRFSPIIERNQPVPISRQQSYFTLHDNQTEILFEVLQGESMVASENLQLGKLTIRIPARPKGEIEIDVRFSYDINGLLEVDVENHEHGIAISQSFQQNNQQLSQEELQASHERLAKLKIHPRDNQENRYLIEKAKRLWEENTGEAREIISHATAQFEDILAQQDEYKIRQYRKQFAELLNHYDNPWFTL